MPLGFGLFGNRSQVQLRGESMPMGDGGYESASSDDSTDTIRVSTPSRAEHMSSLRASSRSGPSTFSDLEDEPSSPLLGSTFLWDSDSFLRRRRRNSSGFRWSRRLRRQWVIFTRHPLVPTQPVTILFSLVLFVLFAILLTLFLIYQLNPDKEALPWRSYCALQLQQPFPPENIGFEQLTPAGVFLGVFSMDSSLERRMFVRTTFASHNRSRVDDGTSRTIVRFIIGRPRGEWERRVQLEAEMYNDIVILPISENMNSGKSYSYFNWAAQHAWVPPPRTSLPFSYGNQTANAPPLAPHDPAPLDGAPLHWVRPDFVVKADDDAFVMLGELEARLRLELHSGLVDEPPRFGTVQKTPLEDPLVYWGYLVKNKFMGGELYALSWDVTSWVSRAQSIRHLTRGAEDKLVAQWMLLHPRAENVRWKSERCWMYDHPKAGTVYSHGFLFPSEATRVRRALTGLGAVDGKGEKKTGAPQDSDMISHSSVSTFGTRYNPPASDLTPPQSIEALVEGSPLSKVSEVEVATTRNSAGSSSEYVADPVKALRRAVEEAYAKREGRNVRYEGKKLGGTVVVHFIKRNEWWAETALALLGGEDFAPGDALSGLPPFDDQREDEREEPDEEATGGRDHRIESDGSSAIVKSGLEVLHL